MNALERQLRATELEIKRVADEAAAVADKAAKEDRELSDEEKSEVQEHLKTIDSLEAKKAKVEGDLELDQRIRNASKGIKVEERPEETKGGLTIGEQFVKSEKFQEMKSKGFSGSWSTGQISIDGKATVTSAASDIVQPQVLGGVVETLFQRLTVADLLASGTTNSSVVRYIKETTATNAAATVAEGAAKPESTIVLDSADEPVRKIATFLPVSDEMLEDVAQLQSYLNQRLALFVKIEEEDQLLNGDGTAPNISGLLDRAGIQTQDIEADALEVAIFKAIGQVRNDAFLEPDGVVINPTDWETIRLATDTNGQYFGGGPFYGPYGGPQGGANYVIERLWGLPVVVTSAIAAGTALVGAFRTAAQVFRRSGLTVEASNSHSDFFQKNLTAIRAEERLALAVYREAAFCKVTQVA